MSTLAERRHLSQLRMVAQRLVGEPWENSLEVAREMMCLQGQDWPGVQLSLALRTKHRSFSEVREAFNSGQLVRTWPQRGTLHVLPAEDYDWYLAMNVRPRTIARFQTATDADFQRRIEQLREVTVEVLTSGQYAGAGEGRDAISRISRDNLRTLWREHYPEIDHRRPLYQFCVDGTLVFGPVDETGSQLLVLADDWIDHSRQVNPVDGAREALRRYLYSHGPSSRKDINWWSGLSLRTIDSVIAELGDELELFTVDGVKYWSPRIISERLAELNLSRSLLILPAFDELVLGYNSRTMTFPREHIETLVPGNNGMFRSSIVAGGIAVGYWRKNAKGLSAELFDEPTPHFSRRLQLAFAELPR